jgi:hypothetical protein
MSIALCFTIEFGILEQIALFNQVFILRYYVTFHQVNLSNFLFKQLFTSPILFIYHNEKEKLKLKLNNLLRIHLIKTSHISSYYLYKGGHFLTIIGYAKWWPYHPFIKVPS